MTNENSRCCESIWSIMSAMKSCSVSPRLRRCLCCRSSVALPPPEYQKLTHDIYKQLIEINTSFSTGATTPAAQAVAERLKAEGFPESDIQMLGAAPHKMNVVVRYHGTGQRKPLLLLAHLDVVEAKRSDWSMDPFQLTEKDGFFYGRGTIDDKAQAAIWIANLIRYKREGCKPDRDLIMALTADEEGGGPYNGVAWLLKNHRDLIDAEYCLNEGGWGDMVNGKHVSNNVQVSEKYVGHVPLRGEEQRRPQLATSSRQRDLPAGRGFGPGVEVQFPGAHQ